MEASRERMHLEPIWLLKAEGEEEGKEGSERQPFSFHVHCEQALVPQNLIIVFWT